MKVYRSILSVTFAFLVLFSSSSLVIGIHFCGGSIQNVALFTKAEPCGMEKQVPACHRHATKPCCEDETIVHEAQGFKSDVSTLTFAPIPVVDIVQPRVLISEVIPSSVSAHTEYSIYDPPLRSSDLTVSLQVFLI